MTRQKSIAEEVRDEEFKAKMELAKEDRERQMQCMQDIRKMSITGKAELDMVMQCSACKT